jgi:hypothetical protein
MQIVFRLWLYCVRSDVFHSIYRALAVDVINTKETLVHIREKDVIYEES